MWKKISNPQWADKDHTAVNCMVKFEHIEQAVPFTATASDTEAYGRDIYAACLRGEAGEIAEYVQPSISPEKARELKTAGINAWRNAMEAANYTFEHNGRKWDYGKSTQTRLEPSVAAAKAGNTAGGVFSGRMRTIMTYRWTAEDADCSECCGRAGDVYQRSGNSCQTAHDEKRD